MKLKPSTLRALFNNDIENAIISETPGGIKAQETRGQQTFINNETLPKEVKNFPEENGWKILESFGIVRGKDADDIFVYVQLPPGWEKVPTDHSMWSNLIDDKGRKRAGLFYKAAFYDRSAFISIECRYSYSVCSVDGWEQSKTSEWHCVATDAGSVIWVSERLSPEPKYDKGNRGNWAKWSDDKAALRRLSESWLNNHYPDWMNPAAYWAE